MFMEYGDGNFLLRLTGLDTGQIRFTVLDPADIANVLYDDVSCVLDMPERMPLKMAVSWGDGEITAYLNGGRILSSKSRLPIGSLYIVPPLKSKPITDFASDNALAITKRRGRLVGWQRNPKRVRATKDEVLKALASETKQLRGVLDHIKNNDLEYLTTLAALLRKMIATGDPLPMLQLFAAFSDRDLIVYTELSPVTQILAGASASMGFSIWPQPTLMDTNPVDIDRWLELLWGQLGIQPVTHRSALTKIGDTIGAHFDWDMHPAVVVLRSGTSEFGGVRTDYLTRYLIQVGITVFELATALIAKG